MEAFPLQLCQQLLTMLKLTDLNCRHYTCRQFIMVKLAASKTDV